MVLHVATTLARRLPGRSPQPTRVAHAATAGSQQAPFRELYTVDIYSQHRGSSIAKSSRSNVLRGQPRSAQILPRQTLGTRCVGEKCERVVRSRHSRFGGRDGLTGTQFALPKQARSKSHSLAAFGSPCASAASQASATRNRPQTAVNAACRLDAPIHVRSTQSSSVKAPCPAPSESEQALRSLPAFEFVRS